MPYLNLDLDYFDHPKTNRLIGLLGRGAAEMPIRLWCYCGKYHADSGCLVGYSSEEIEAVVRWWGKPGEMIDCMIKVGLLKKIRNGYQINDWKEHSWHLSAFKKRAKAAAANRWNKYKSNACSNACSNAKDDVKQSPYHTIPTIPTIPNINTLSCKHDLEAPVFYLNEKAGKRFDPKSKAISRLVKARYAEGRRLEDFKRVVDLKVSKWLGDPKMCDYLRPSTLFNATNFENYINESEKEETDAERDSRILAKYEK